MAFVRYNANPVGNIAGDCVIRAISKATDVSWEEVYAKIALQGFLMSDMPSANRVWMTYLKNAGFRKYIIPDTCPDCYTVRDFCMDNPDGTFVLWVDGQQNGHVVCVIDGNYYDTWDSGNEFPVFFWRKE